MDPQTSKITPIERSTDSPVNTDEIIKKVKAKKRSPINWFCFFIFAHAIYFNENFYSSLAPDMVGDSKTGLLVCFIHFPKFLFKLFSVYFINKIPIRIRVHIFWIFSIFSSVVLLLFFPELEEIKTAEASLPIDEIPLGGRRLLVSIIAVTFGCVCMALGEITILGYSSHFASSCVNGWSAGSGFAGLTAGLSVILLKRLAKHESRVKWFAIFNAAVMPTLPLFFFFFLKRPLKAQTSEKEKKKLSNGSKKGDFEINDKNYNGIENEEEDNCIVEVSSNVKDDRKKIKDDIMKKGLIKKLIALFKDLRAYTIPLALGYFIYFTCFSGILPYMKKYNKLKDTIESEKFLEKMRIDEGTISEKSKGEANLIATRSFNFFNIAFLVIRAGVFIFRSMPQFVKFYKVWTIPSVHIISCVILVLVCSKFECNKALSFVGSIPLGLGHGAVVGYTNLGLRVKAEERLRHFGLSYINVASALGATVGNLLALAVFKFMGEFFGYPKRT